MSLWSALVVLVVALVFLFVGFQLGKRSQSPKKKIVSEVKPLAHALGDLDDQFAVIDWIFSNIPITVWMTDQRLALVDSFSPLIEKRNGTQMENFIGVTLWDIFQTKDKTHTGINAHLRALEGEEVSYEVDWGGRVFAARVHPWREGDRLKGCLGIALDVTEVRSKEEKVQALTGELGRTQNDLQRFAYAVSHDLKEPVRMISGYMRLLEKKFPQFLDKEAKECVQVTIESAKRLHNLVDSLLDFCRAGNVSLSVAPVDLNGLVNAAMKDYSSALMSRNGQSVVLELPTVLADETLLQQVFRNLISNAIKFSRGVPPKITISTCPSEEGDVITVSDNGIGIETEYLQKIFVPFTRLHTRDQYEGDGIGLSLCSRIMERHGGRIWAESAEGRGTTFYLLFPRHPALTGTSEISHA